MIISQQNDEIEISLELPLDVEKEIRAISGLISFKSGDNIRLTVRVPYILDKEFTNDHSRHASGKVCQSKNVG